MWQNTFIHHGNIVINKELVDFVLSHNWSKPHLCNNDINFSGSQQIYYTFSGAAPYELYHRNYDKNDIKLRLHTLYILKEILKIWPDYRFIKGEISHCPPGEQQGMHIDPRIFHRLGYRVHVPIVTNSCCFLKVGQTQQHLAQGEIWTFNNIEMHSSENLGNTPRVHIVVDIIKQSVFDQFVKKYSESKLFEKTVEQFITI